MNNCEYCGEFNASYEEGHLDSETHQYNYFLSLKNDWNCRVENGLNINEQRILDDTISKMKSQYDKNEIVECGNVDNTECKFSGSLKEVMVHERCCIGFMKEEQKEEYSYIECQQCNKRFYDKGQKMKPIYSLNAHKKLCEISSQKVLKREITLYLKQNTIDINVLKNIKQLLYSKNDK